MQELLDMMKDATTLLPAFTVQNVISVIIETGVIAFIVYELLSWIVDTKAWSLLKGIVVITVFILLSALLRLNTILWIVGNSALFLGLALIVIFQPELRRMLEKIGNQDYSKMLPIIGRISSSESDEASLNNTINEIVKAVFSMSKVKTGALIVIQQKMGLDDINSTGIMVDGIVSSGLLINIFEKNTPLHDGAVVINKDRVVSATCYLPLSDNLDISKDYGTRHRAALGVSENTDTITVVVSEETGGVTVAESGALTKIKDADALRKVLSRAYFPDADTSKSAIQLRKGRRKNGNQKGTTESK